MELPIKRNLSEETRLQTIIVKGRVYDLHYGLGDDRNYYITEHAQEDKIYAVLTDEIYNQIFG